MGAWWEGLEIIQKILAGAAIPATVILLLQTVLLLFGIGNDQDADADGDVDLDGDGVPDGDSDGSSVSDGVDGLRLFTVRGMIAFFAIGGWTGVVLTDIGANELVTILGALIAGSVATYLVALFMKMAFKLQDKGNIMIENAIGKGATVYLTIPANAERTGKITMDLQGRFVELDACTNSEEPLKTGLNVKVVDVVNETTVLVEKNIEMKRR